MRITAACVFLVALLLRRVSIVSVMLLQAQSSEALPAAVCACSLHSHLFSSTALGTTEPVHEPTPSTSYLATDDEVSIAPQLAWPLLLNPEHRGTLWCTASYLSRYAG